MLIYIPLNLRIRAAKAIYVMDIQNILTFILSGEQ